MSTQTQEVSPEVIALAKKMQEQKAKKEATMREEIGNKHPHALTDTLTFDEAAKKYKVRIKCTKTGNTDRWVFTSDLHQVKVCQAVSDEQKADKKAKKNAEIKAARALIRQQAGANQG